MRPNYRQNAQWTFRNRSQSRNRNENYSNEYILEAGVEVEAIVDPSQGEEKNLGRDLSPGLVPTMIE